jgi:hypothetical protein
MVINSEMEAPNDRKSRGKVDDESVGVTEPWACKGWRAGNLL